MKRTLLFTFFIIASRALAQQKDTTTILLKEVIVEAARSELSPMEIPASISTISARDIQGIQAGISAEESLRRVPGIFVNNRYNFSQGERISIRGLGSRSQFGVKNIKILLDGIPLTFADGQAQLNNLDLSSAGSMEILRGANASLYGNAAGGVILINSERERTELLKLTPEFTTGFGGLLKGNLKATGAFKNFDYLASFSATNFDGFREHSAAKFYNLNAITGFAINDSSRISLIFNLYDAPYLMNPGGLLKAETEDDRRTKTRAPVKKNAAGKITTQGQTGLRYTANFENDQRIDATLYGVLRTLDNPIVGRIINLDRMAGGFRSVYEKGFLKENEDFNFRISGGIDAEIQSDERQEFQNLGTSDSTLQNAELVRSAQKSDVLTHQEENITAAGIFSQISIRFLKDFRVNLGGRFDNFSFTNDDFLNNSRSGDLTFSQFSPSVGVVYNVFENASFYGNYSSAFQTPSANELGNSPTGGFNRDLRPERIRSFETGFKTFFENLFGEIAAFYFTADNQLIPYQISATSDETFFRNAGQTQNSGVETSFEYSFLKGFRAQASYTFMRYIFNDYLIQSGANLAQLSGNFVPGVPQHIFFGGLSYEHESGLSGEITAQYSGEYFVDDANSFKNEAFLTTDIRLGFLKTFDTFGFKIFGGIQNIFDVRYNSSIIPNAAGNRFYEPAPGRSWYASVEIPLMPLSFFSRENAY